MAIQLRVHARAPSTRKDDDKYRAQAEAYAAFRWNVVECQNHLKDPALVEQANGQPQDDHSKVLANNGNATVECDPTTFVEETQLAWDALQSQLLTSSLDARSQAPAKALLKRTACAIEEGKTFPAQVVYHAPGDARSQTPPLESLEYEHLPKKRRIDTSPRHRSYGGDRQGSLNSESQSRSSYLRTPVLDRSSKKGQVSEGHRFYPKAPSPPFVALSEANQIGVAFLGKNSIATVEQHQHFQMSQGNETTSELPTSYSLTNITSESSRGRVRNSQRSSSDPGPRVFTASQDGRRRKSQPTSLERIPATTLQTNEPKDQPNGTSDRLAQQLPKIADEVCFGTGNPKASDTLKVDTCQGLSLQIRTSEPVVSTAQFKTHVTEKLHFLAEQSCVADHYNPVSITREIRSLERGFWLVDPASWSLQLQVSFWQYLEMFVGDGNAGWGVSCIREQPDADASTAASLGIVKVFCWGEVLKHIYLLLYVASKSKARKNSQWIDAEEKVVVQMRSI